MNSKATGVVITPYRTNGGRHPSGSILSYRFYLQKDGSTRLDCINGGYLVDTKGGLTEHQAESRAESFMRDGDMYDGEVLQWTRHESEGEAS